MLVCDWAYNIWTFQNNNDSALKFVGRLHGEYNTKFSFVETPSKFTIAKLSIRKLGSSSVLKIHYYPNLRIESFAIINLRGLSTKLNVIVRLQIISSLRTKKIITWVVALPIMA